MSAQVIRGRGLADIVNLQVGVARGQAERDRLQRLQESQTFQRERVLREEGARQQQRLFGREQTKLEFQSREDQRRKANAARERDRADRLKKQAEDNARRDREEEREIIRQREAKEARKRAQDARDRREGRDVAREEEAKKDRITQRQVNKELREENKKRKELENELLKKKTGILSEEAEQRKKISDFKIKNLERRNKIIDRRSKDRGADIADDLQDTITVGEDQLGRKFTDDEKERIARKLRRQREIAESTPPAKPLTRKQQLKIVSEQQGIRRGFGTFLENPEPEKVETLLDKLEELGVRKGLSPQQTQAFLSRAQQEFEPEFVRGQTIDAITNRLNAIETKEQLNKLLPANEARSILLLSKSSRAGPRQRQIAKKLEELVTILGLAEQQNLTPDNIRLARTQGLSDPAALSRFTPSEGPLSIAESFILGMPGIGKNFRNRQIRKFTNLFR